ncbi:MAG TPA: hypothetical protein VG455_07595 [Acidimicrobiales bacterium]|nr:hypothetical protein [Acidimicrobiales bacterium]
MLTWVATPARAGTAEVPIADMAFSPETGTGEAEAGEPDFPAFHAHVNFLMRDEGVEHTVSFDDRALGVGSSGRLAAGQVYPVIIERVGTFTYRCEIHSTMTGTVVVTEPAAATEPEGDVGGGSGTSVAVTVTVAVLVTVVAVAVLVLLRRRRAADAPRPARRSTR